MFGNKLSNEDITEIESKGRYHGNQFWDYISCKWILTGDNDIEISYKGWFVFSKPCVYWSLSLDSQLRRSELQGIDTLISIIYGRPMK